nr:protein yippee-like 3 isoform X2 [Equus caballus]
MVVAPGEAAGSGERRQQPSVTESQWPWVCLYVCGPGPDSPLTSSLQALGSLCSPWAAPRVGPLPPAPAMVRISKPKTFQAYLDDCHRRYSCAHCRAHLANHDDLISKSFQGSQGRAYLFNSVNRPLRAARSTKRGSTSLNSTT